MEDFVRSMSIPRFPRTIDILDFDHFVRTRIIQEVVMWPDQAIPLCGSMGWPNDPDTRKKSIDLICRWFDASEAIPERLLPIQRDWVRVADIFNLHIDLTDKGHQERRGGPSVGKAIELAQGRIKSRGARKSNLWRAWSDYKDVAHLVTAATIIASHARRLATIAPIGHVEPWSNQLQPLRITLLMPDFVLALALSLQEYGLSHVAKGIEEPMLDPETLWRVPADINVKPVQAPVRPVTKEGLFILHARRAGNRGKKAQLNAVQDGTVDSDQSAPNLLPPEDRSLRDARAGS